jgi:hypothetical protein
MTPLEILVYGIMGALIVGTVFSGLIVCLMLRKSRISGNNPKDGNLNSDQG